MDKEKLQFYFLIVLLIAVIILAGFIFRPFLSAFIMAVVFAVIFRPLHLKSLQWAGSRKGVAALLTVSIIIVLVVAPLLFLGTQIFHEAQRLYASVSDNGGKDGILKAIKSMVGSLEQFSPRFQGFSLDLDQYLEKAVRSFVEHMGDVFSSFAKIIANSFIFLIALYYILKDGQKIKQFIITLSPLSDTDDEMIFKKLALAVRSVIKGGLAIACIQGFLAGAGFAFFGIPNPILWGTITAIAAIIPAIGTALVLIPAILFLFISGQTIPAVGLLIWSIAAVGLIDNFLGPKLVSRGMELHPFMIFISVLGGMAFFGPLGFILGPLVMNLLHLFASRQDQKYNQIGYG